MLHGEVGQTVGGLAWVLGDIVRRWGGLPVTTPSPLHFSMSQHCPDDSIVMGQGVIFEMTSNLRWGSGKGG